MVPCFFFFILILFNYYNLFQFINKLKYVVFLRILVSFFIFLYFILYYILYSSSLLYYLYCNCAILFIYYRIICAYNIIINLNFFLKKN